MKTLEKNQSGFSAIYVALAIFAVAVLIATGWFVYRHNHMKSSSTVGNTNQSSNQQMRTTTSPGSTVAYLDIKEWGVKLPLPDGIKNAYYTIGKGSSDGPRGVPTTAWLGLSSFTSPNCNPANNDSGKSGAIGAMYRIHPTETDPVNGQLLTQEYPNGTTIGSYYYAYKGFTTSNPCASQTTLQPIDSAFAGAAKGIVSDTTAAN